MRNVLGAFADAGILFPLLAALSLRPDFSAPRLLLSAGAAYLAAGWVFRVPMSVQPLKSIAIAALAIGASSLEVRLSGAILGAFCLLLAFFRADRWATRVPPALIHTLQLALGILLIRQGFSYVFHAPGLITENLGTFAALTLALVMIPARTGFPLLGLLALGGVVWAIFHGSNTLPSASVARSFFTPSTKPDLPVRLGFLAVLVLPQLALTLGNSVLGTADVARRAFGARARRVTERRLLFSIGLGNIAAASVGGLPYCHGSGGLTAHIRGGADHWRTNVVMGSTLLLLGGWAYFGHRLSLAMPPTLLASLLATTGIFHLGLASPTWNAPFGKAKLLLAAVLIALTGSMLWVVAVAALLELIQHPYQARQENFA